MFSWYLFQRIALRITPERVTRLARGRLRLAPGHRRGGPVTDERLLALIGDYPTAVLSWVRARRVPGERPVPRAPAPQAPSASRSSPCRGFAAGWRGPACLLFHLHDEHLEGLRQMVVKGAWSTDGPAPTGASEFVVGERRHRERAARHRRMPHAGAPLHMLQFYRLGRRQAQAYLAKRGDALAADPVRRDRPEGPGRPGRSPVTRKVPGNPKGHGFDPVRLKVLSRTSGAGVGQGRASQDGLRSATRGRLVRAGDVPGGLPASTRAQHQSRW